MIIKFFFKWFLTVGFGLVLLPLFGQMPGSFSDNQSNKIIKRLAIKTKNRAIKFTNLSPLSRNEVVAFALKKDSTTENISKVMRDNLEVIFKNNNENPLLSGEKFNFRRKPILKYFYQSPAWFYEKTTEDYYLRFNPLIDIRYGLDREDDDPIFWNRRGIEIRAGIDKWIHFYTNITENQASFPEYVDDYISRNKAIPGFGFYKNFSSGIFNSKQAFDFTNARGLIDFNISKHAAVQFGHGQNFIGSGYRSLLLSDFAVNYFYLKLNWRAGDFVLQNIFAEAAARSAAEISGDELLPKKFTATHYLGWQPSSNFQIGLFESVVFNRRTGFELQYLNPVILYRTVETYLGSPDNVLLGTDVFWNFLPGFQAYGQFVLDEFKFDELFIEKRGWWANKYAGQFGLKIVDLAGIESLDLQTEYNFARPYTFTSRDSSYGSYSHHNQALAHPLGANFQELIGILKYRPTKRISLKGRIIRQQSGEDPGSRNFGANILLPNSTHPMDFGNELGQGVEAKTLILGLEVSYRVFQNAFLDLTFFQRNKKSVDTARNQKTNYIGGGFRINLDKQKHDF